MDSDSNLFSTEGDVTKVAMMSARSSSDDDLEQSEQSVVVDANENHDEAEVTKTMTSDGVATSTNAVFESSGDEQSVVVDDANDNEERVIDHETEGDERRELSEELWRSVVKLSCESSAEGGNCDVYLVGTAHVSMLVADVGKLWNEYYKLELSMVKCLSLGVVEARTKDKRKTWLDLWPRNGIKELIYWVLELLVLLLELNQFKILLGEMGEGQIASDGWPFVFVVPGQMTRLVASMTLDSARSCVMQVIIIAVPIVVAVVLVVIDAIIRLVFPELWQHYQQLIS
nr:TraB domain-containing protein-like [Tanacetum cinerariifolium]